MQIPLAARIASILIAAIIVTACSESPGPRFIVSMEPRPPA